MDRILELPYDYTRPLELAYSGKTLVFKLENMDKLIKKYVSTEFNLWISVYALFLSKITNSNEVYIGFPFNSRNNIETSNMIGYFVNTLILKSKICGSFTELLENNKNYELNLMNQNKHLIEILEEFSIKRESNRNPIFQTMITVETESDDKDVESYKGTAKFDLSIVIGKDNISFEYMTELFTEETIKKFSKIFQQIIDNLLESDKTNFSIATLEEISIMREWNDNDIPIENKFIYDYIEPSKKVAIEYEGQYMTYSEMHDKMIQIAKVLQFYNVKKESLVGVLLDRDIMMIPSLMGILRAGGAYVPVLENYPEGRLQFILQEDCECKYIVTETKYKDKFKWAKKIRRIRASILKINIHKN
jgi:non-ribosomal peptide synthetase component F